MRFGSEVRRGVVGASAGGDAGDGAGGDLGEAGVPDRDRRPALDVGTPFGGIAGTRLVQGPLSR